MAGDWIKMRADLQTHPKVVRIASALGADRLRTIGALHAVWCVFDAHSVDGSLCGYTPETLDDMIGWRGFVRAMESVEWVDVNGEVLSLPRFDEHNGQSAKRRAMDATRKRRNREARPQSVRKMSASGADKKRTREEKRRGEEKRESVVPSSQQIRVADERPSLVLPEDGLEAVDIVGRTWAIVASHANPLDDFTVSRWLTLHHPHPWCIAAAICEAEAGLRTAVNPVAYLRGIVEKKTDWSCAALPLDEVESFVTHSLNPDRRARMALVSGGVA